ncbi:MAG: zf-HC2 domain-containing protein [Planctomycetota bacterium]
MEPEAAEQADRCKYFEGLFSPYMAGELASEERQALAEHIRACESCSEAFGLAWKAFARVDVDKGRFGRGRATDRRGASQRRMLWVLCLVSLAGLVLLSAAGWIGGQGRNPLREGKTPVGLLVDESLAEMLTLQTRLMKALSEPVIAPPERIPHAAQGEVRDFVEAWSARPEPGPAREALLDRALHRMFRAVDLAPGGREWDRLEMLGEWRAAMPRLVLVEVEHASRDTATVKLVVGDRPARAVLVREPRDGEALADGQRADMLRLAWLAFLAG